MMQFSREKTLVFCQYFVSCEPQHRYEAGTDLIHWIPIVD